MRKSHPFILPFALAMSLTLACNKDEPLAEEEEVAEVPTSETPAPDPQPDDTENKPEETPKAENSELPTTAPAVATPGLLFTAYPEVQTLAASGSISFTVAGTDTATSFACSWDGATFSACTSPQAYSNFTAGGHTLQVRLLAADGTVLDEGVRAFLVQTTLSGNILMNYKLAADTYIVRDLTEDSQGTLIAATSKGILLLPQGASSATLRTTSDGLGNNNVFSVTKDGAGRLYAGTAVGLSVSSDNGASWTVKTTSDGLPSNTVVSVHYDSLSGLVYVGTYGGLMATTDGTSFTSVSLNGGPSTGIAQVYTYPSGEVIITNTSSRYYIASSMAGVFTQVPGMTSSQNFKIGANGHVYGISSSGVYISKDKGATFSLKTSAHGLPSNDVRGVTATASGTVYVGTAAGLSISYDGGDSFISGTRPSNMSGSSLFRGLDIDSLGRIFFGSNEYIGFSLESSKNRTGNTDAKAPVLSDMLITQTSAGNSGVGISWTPASDDITPAASIRYFLFKSATSTYSSVAEIVRYATLIEGPRYGVRNAAVSLSASASSTLYLLALDAAGNASAYTPKTVTADASARTLNFTQTVADAGLGVPVDHAVVTKGLATYHIGGVDLSAGASVRNQVWSTTSQASWSSINQGSSQLAERYGHTATLFNDQIVLIGGVKSDALQYADVVASATGTNWSILTNTPGFMARVGHTALVFNNRLWVIAGQGTVSGTATSLNDVWSSADGITWQQETAAAPFRARYDHTSLVFGGKMWVIGGTSKFATTAEQLNNDVWYSENGKDWYQACGTLPMGPVSNAASVVYQNRMWIIGGYAASNWMGVWSSTDGAYWEQANTNSTFPSREWHAAAIGYDGLIYFYNGNYLGYKADVWSAQ